MKKLLYDNFPIICGIGNLLSIYNNAVLISVEKNMDLVVPRLRSAHNIDNTDFKIERFFGLDVRTQSEIQEIFNSKNTEYMGPGSVSLSYRTDYIKTKEYLFNKFLNGCCFLNTCNYPSHKISGKINIAVHIRRGDIVLGKDKIHHNRIISDLWWKTAVENIIKIKKLDRSDVHINIYSETRDGIYYNDKSEPANIQNIFNFDSCSFHLSTNIFECMYNMIDSDIFMAGRWGFALALTPYREWLNRESFLEKENAPVVAYNKYTNTHIIPEN